MAVSRTDVQRASEIVEEMQNLLDEFDGIVRHVDSRITYERFRAYPKGHISMALTKESDYLGSDMFTLEEIVTELQDEVEAEESDEE